MDMDFPIQPLLNEVIVREIPVKDYFRVDEYSKHIDLDNSNIKVISNRGEVVAVSSTVQQVKIGDVVQFDEFCRYAEIYLNPADRYRSDLPHYFKMRVADLDGVLTHPSPKMTYLLKGRAISTSDFSDNVRQNLTPEGIEPIIENARSCGQDKICLPIKLPDGKFDSVWMDFEQAREFVNA
jgi:hypothetical protein